MRSINDIMHLEALIQGTFFFFLNCFDENNCHTHSINFPTKYLELAGRN